MAQEKCFADTVISKAVEQISPGSHLDDKDYSLIRSVFRNAGGSWEKFVSGDIGHVRLLKETVKVWVARDAAADKR